jgi:eukaryotic-like serine/threonine-protein kinase
MQPMSADQPLTSCPQCGKKFPATVRMCPDDGSVLEHTMMTTSHAGQVLDGKYRLDALLAEGGMGAVYRATHVMLGKTVAIKLIRPAIVASPEIVRRFQREARAATALNHPNIVSVYDLGQTPDGTLYIAMEYIDGPSLKTLIQAGRSIPLTRTIAILRQVASALATAHKHNIIHRDLKPHNIMLAEGLDGSEVAKLVDFGIAKTFDESTQLTSAGSALGTPYYMSPEQIEGRTVDARSDLYALGIILYEMLVGEVPFADQSTPAVLVKQLKERPVRPSLRNAAVPASLETIALRCLEKDPALRFQSADEFAAALNEASAALTATSADVTLPMVGAVPSAPEVGSAQPGATAVSSVNVASPSPTPAAMASPPLPATPIAPQAAASPKSAGDTKPTVEHPAMSALPVPPPPMTQPQPSASIVPLLAIAAVLLLLAGGYLWWSNRQPPAAPTAAATLPADAPQTTPASAQPPPPASTDASKPSEPPGPPPPLSPPPAAESPSVAASNPSAATAAATRESQAATNRPPANPATATRAATAAAASATRGASASPTPSANAPAQRPTPQTPFPPREASPPPNSAPTIPENAAVVFRCGGAPEVCASLRTAVDDALDKAGFQVVTSPARADVAVGAIAGVLDEKASRQFGQTFNTRTYQIELTGEAPKFGDSVAMPPASTVSFDATVGRERLEEKARLVASDVVDRVRAYVKKKRGS